MFGLRDHGGSYGGGKYRSNKTYPEEIIIPVSSKGNGEVIWKSPDNTIYAGRIRFTQNRVIINNANSGKVYALAKNGEALGIIIDLGDVVIGAIEALGDRILLTTNISSGGFVGIRCYSETGALLWNKTTNEVYNGSTVTITNGRTLSFYPETGDFIFGNSSGGSFGSTLYNVAKFNKDGTMIWANGTAGLSATVYQVAALPNGGAVKNHGDGGKLLSVIGPDGITTNSITLTTGQGAIPVFCVDKDRNVYVSYIDATGARRLAKYTPELNFVKETIVPFVTSGLPIVLMGEYIYVPGTGGPMKVSKNTMDVIGQVPLIDGGQYITLEDPELMYSNRASGALALNPRKYLELA